jgi:hypothetical protein
MVKKCATLVALLLITTFVRIPDASPTITTFTASTGGSANFTGNSSKFLKVTTAPLNMSNRNFTISWWQRSIAIQTAYPRILQFGDGSDYREGFAISEEIDGSIYLWINRIKITSIANPNHDNALWNHIAIIRNGYDYSWFINGVFISTSNHISSTVCINGMCTNNQFANFDTSNLDLLIGAGNDAGTGGFTGNLAGVQISQSVRWTTTFTPPTNFQNPGTGLAFSMYVNQTDVVDTSGNNLTVVPIVTSHGELADDFYPPSSSPSPDPSPEPSPSPDPSPEPSPSPDPSPEPSPSPDPSPDPSPPPDPSPDPIDWSQYPSKFVVDYPGQNAFLWGSELSLYKDGSAPAFDFDLIEHISIGVPVTYSVSDEDDPVETICYLEVTDSGVSSENELWFELWQFHYLIFELVGSTCGGYQIPDYQYEMLGETQTAVSIYLWTEENVTDFSEIDDAFEELQINMLIPPYVSGLSITRGDNIETDLGRISFGDIVTVTIANDAAMAGLAMAFAVPEAYSDADGVGSDQNVCFYYPIYDNDTDQRIFALPTLNDLLTTCREQYDGDWEFDLYAERMFYIFALDESGNFSPDGISPLILNPVSTIEPPEILGHTITRMSNIDLDTNRLHSGDTIHLSFANSQNTSEMFWSINLPEAFRIGDSPNNNAWCDLWIEADTNGVFLESVTVPSSSQIYSHCHGENFYSGDWTYDESVSRSIRIFAEDSEGNGIGYPRVDSPLTLAAKVQTPEPDPTAPPTSEPTPPKKIIPEEPTPQQETQPTPPAPIPPAPTPPAPTPPAPTTPDQKVMTPEPVLNVAEKPIKSSLVAKTCIKAGVWIFTKNNLLQICDTELKIVLAIPACTGKKATPTYPWLFKAQRFKPGYSSSQSGQKLYYSVFFFKGLAIAGVEKVSSKPCSNGSVFIEKKYAKQVFDYIGKNKSLISVKS